MILIFFLKWTAYKERGKRKKNKKNIKDTSKLRLCHHRCHKKNLNERNLPPPKKITNNNQNVLHLPFKGDG
jgi:hypothetical protein